MKRNVLFLICFLSIHFSYSQLYTNEIEVKETDNNVGIGTDNPIAKTDVVGTLRALEASRNLTSGIGLEVRFFPELDWGGILSYDRTNGLYKPIKINGSDIDFVIGNTSYGKFLSDGRLVLGSSSTGSLNYGRIIVFGEGSDEGLSIYNNTGTTFRIFRDNDVAYIGRGGDPLLGISISNDGKVGIGTNIPEYSFEVKGAGNQIVASNSSNDGIARMGTSDIHGGYFGLHNLSGEQKMLLRGYTIDNVQGYFLEGNIGIGMSTPVAKLEINDSGTIGSNIDNRNNAYFLIQDGTNGMYFDNNEIQTFKVDGSGSHDLYINSSSNPGDTYLNRSGGKVGIGTSSPDEKLHVNGNIKATSFKATNGSVWPDYVFKESYDLPSLVSLKKYINQYGHLPNIPSEMDVKENGVDLVEMNAKLLEKIEEMTLHMIRMNEEIEKLKSKISN